MTAIRIKDGAHRITTNATAITIELEPDEDGYRLVVWQGNHAVHISHLKGGAAIKILNADN
ncbi:hypothetical protein [Micrococcus sp. TA1]|uniref:hypothetical protein n=1 Tax=Micrococcus sp. TA1 TaxID=681627 RepID=UPI00161E471E|nr:hypothetical protein [Micrococcus sp. TA1]MBB5748553.1 hypothetical protein [Micrococcus sp. TA1]